jgi:hypothetical protein
MNRYRKIDPRFWKDEKIIQFSPKEKLIALYLFTGQSNRIGIFSFSPGEAAEDIGTLPQTFAERFQNVCRVLNLGWDETYRVLYLPTWWKYNPPENSNNVIGNLKDLDDVPKSHLIDLFAENLEHLPENLRETFTQTLAQRYPQRYPKRSPSQEQEQEQDKESASASPLPLLSNSITKKKRTSPAPNPDVRSFFTFWAEAYAQRFDQAYHFTGKDGARIKSALNTFKLDHLVALARKFLDSDDEWIQTKGGFTIGVFVSQLNKLASTTDLAKSNGQAKPAEVKELADGLVLVDGRPMDRRLYQRRFANAGK